MRVREACLLLSVLFTGVSSALAEGELEYYQAVMVSNRENVRNARVDMVLTHETPNVQELNVEGRRYFHGQAFITTEYALDGSLLASLTGDLLSPTAPDQFLIKAGTLHKYFSGAGVAHRQASQLAKPNYEVDPLHVVTNTPDKPLEYFFTAPGSRLLSVSKLSEHETALSFEAVMDEESGVNATFDMVFDGRFGDMPTACDYTIYGIRTVRLEWSYEDYAPRQRAIFPKTWKKIYFGREGEVRHTATCEITKVKLLSDWARDTLELPLPGGVAVLDGIEKKAFHTAYEDRQRYSTWLWLPVALVGSVMGLHFFRKHRRA